MPAGPPSNNVIQVALEGSRVYVTTSEDGVGRFDGKAWRLWPPVACTGAGCDTTFRNPNAALGLLVDALGHKWVGCWSFALDELDDSESPPVVTHHVVATNQELQRRTWVLSATVDRQGGHWFGMDTPAKGDIDPIGLEQYDASGNYVRNWNPANARMAGTFVHALAVSGNGRIWVGYDDKGLDFFTLPVDSTKFLHIVSANNLSIRGLATYGDSVWALTSSELLRFSQGAGTSSPSVDHIAMPGTQPLFGVHPLAVGPDGTVWAGSVSGLSAFHPGGRTESFTTHNSPLSDDEVHAIAVDPTSGVVWVATASGLNRYDPFYVLPTQPVPRTLHVQVYPNPLLLTGLGATLRLKSDAPLVQGEVVDVTGRRVRRFGATASGQVFWDGRAEDGSLVEPGVYLIRAEAGGRQTITRLVLLR